MRGKIAFVDGGATCTCAPPLLHRAQAITLFLPIITTNRVACQVLEMSRTDLACTDECAGRAQPDKGRADTRSLGMNRAN